MLSQITRDKQVNAGRITRFLAQAFVYDQFDQLPGLRNGEDGQERGSRNLPFTLLQGLRIRQPRVYRPASEGIRNGR